MIYYFLVHIDDSLIPGNDEFLLDTAIKLGYGQIFVGKDEPT